MESKRLCYIDWLRPLVILTLIPFHAAMPFLILTTPLGDSTCQAFSFAHTCIA
jgi:hypothetical protein